MIRLFLRISKFGYAEINRCIFLVHYKFYINMRSGGLKDEISLSYFKLHQHRHLTYKWDVVGNKNMTVVLGGEL